MLDLIMWVGGLAVTGIFGLIGWVFTMIFGKIDAHAKNHNELETRFDAHRLYAAETFTTKHDLSSIRNEIVTHLNRIEDKLDRKADKGL